MLRISCYMLQPGEAGKNNRRNTAALHAAVMSRRAGCLTESIERQLAHAEVRPKQVSCECCVSRRLLSGVRSLRVRRQLWRDSMPVHMLVPGRLTPKAEHVLMPSKL